MARSKLDAALKKTGGMKAIVDTTALQDYSTEELRLEAYRSRDTHDRSSQEAIANDNRRSTLMKQMGFDLFDIEDLQPHPQNTYSLDPEEIENLAASIYESGNTTPVVVRALPEGGYQLLGGERRWQAHKILTKKYGDAWRMIPGRNLGEISDEDALFVLHSDNIGQRVLTHSERARGFEIVANRIAQQRESDPEFRARYKGKKTRAILAEQFHVSETTVANEIAISKKLPDSGKALLDDGRMGKEQALSITKLPEEKREAVISKVAENDLDNKAISELVTTVLEEDLQPEEIQQNIPTLKRREKTTNDYLKNAFRSLRKAYLGDGQADFALLGKIKQLVVEIERQETNQN